MQTGAPDAPVLPPDEVLTLLFLESGGPPDADQSAFALSLYAVQPGSSHQTAGHLFARFGVRYACVVSGSPQSDLQARLQP